MEMLLELKKEASSDPFTDVVRDGTTVLDLDLENLNDEKREVLGQLLDYFDSMFYNTFRTHAFMVLLTGQSFVYDPRTASSHVVPGDFARLLRCDHSAIVVSERFNYIHEPLKLVAFLEAFSRADAATRGWDTSVKLASNQEVIDARACIALLPDTNPHRNAFGGRLIRLEVPLHSDILKFAEAARDTDVSEVPEVLQDKKAPQKQKVAACIAPIQPNFDSGCLHGRATRGWVVVNLETQRLMYLKRAWRIDEGGLCREGATYERLRDAEVPHLPRIQAHGDVPGPWHATCKTHIANTLWMQAQRSHLDKLRQQQHYGLLMVEVGIKLTAFPSSKIAVLAIRDAIEGMSVSYRGSSECSVHVAAYDADYTKADTMHRDISAGNILIYMDEAGVYRGLLVDWDLCKHLTGTSSNSSFRTVR
jgi:hypothetical protein